MIQYPIAIETQEVSGYVPIMKKTETHGNIRWKHKTDFIMHFTSLGRRFFQSLRRRKNLKCTKQTPAIVVQIQSKLAKLRNDFNATIQAHFHQF